MIEDLTGRRLGMLVVERQTKSINKRSRWRCICDCGAEINTRGDLLRRGAAKSCGCTRDLAVRRANTKHGLSGTRIYRTWIGMVRRCSDPRVEAYQDYGARGIRVCKRWLNFECFFADMGHPPAGRTLERRNNDRGYNRKNCRWATMKEQARNRRSSRFVVLHGDRITVAEAAERHNLHAATVRGRLNRGIDIERAVHA